MSQGAGGAPSKDRGNRHPSFAELYDTFDRPAYARAMEVLRDHHLAEDAVQESFVRVARALDRGEIPVYPSAWILTIARNEALRIAGRKGIITELPKDPPADTSTRSSQEKVDELDERRKVRDTLAVMDEEEARLLAERYLEGLSSDVLRRREGLSGSGFWKRLRKAKDSFRRRFRRPPGGGE